MKVVSSNLVDLVALQENPESEPAFKVGTATGTVAGILSLIVLLAPNFLSDKQLGIVAVIGAILLPIITAAFTRGKVWSPASVQEVVDQAVKEAVDAVTNSITKPSILKTPRPMTLEEADEFKKKWPE